MKREGTVTFTFIGLDWELDYQAFGHYHPGSYDEPPEFPDVDLTQLRLANHIVTQLMDLCPPLEDRAYEAVQEELCAS